LKRSAGCTRGSVETTLTEPRASEYIGPTCTWVRDRWRLARWQVELCLAIWVDSLLSLLLRDVAISLCAFRSLVCVS
jgi:hypothetical protein